jgi:hypothetical protein
MKVPFSGRCACGAVRYSCAADPLYGMNCHCRDCQRETGSAYAPVIGIPKAAFKVTHGTPKCFEVTADSGSPTRRFFCADCGSPLFGEPGVTPDVVTIRVGSLDDPSAYQPTGDIYISSAQPWDFMNPSLPKSPKLPKG